MASAIFIRVVKKKDLDKFWKFRIKYVGRHHVKSAKLQYSKNKDLFIECVHGGELIGVAHGYIKDDLVILSGMAVRDDYWKKGVGKKILKFFEKRAKKTGKQKVSLGAAKNVVGFYESCGYKIIKPLKKYTLMEKRI